MKLYQKIIAGIIFLVSVVLICLFKNLPTGKVWQNYSVLYVQNETPDYLVVDILKANKINDYVSLGNQFLPVNLGKFSPELSFLRANYDSPAFSYLNKRNAYFYDKSNSYRLYYIPSNHKNKLGKVAGEFSSKKIFCGMDTSSNYPFIIPVLLVLVFALFIFYSKNKIFFASTAFLPVLFVFCNPFYTISIAVIMILLCLFFISNVWNRRNAFIYLISNYAIPSMFAVGIIAGFACNYKVGLLYLLCILGTASAGIIYYEAEQFIAKRKSFNPVYIISAKRTSIFARKKMLILPVCVGFSTLLLIFFFITSFSNINTKSAKILIPAEKKHQAEELPTIDEYIQWVWNVETAPYTSLNDFSNNKVVYYPHYTKTDKAIKESYQSYEYTDAYKESVFTGIDQLPFESIEKVLKSQGKDIITGYTSTSSYSTSLFGIIVLLISYLILLFFYISSIITKGFKK